MTTRPATLDEIRNAWDHAATFWPTMFPMFEGPAWTRQEFTVKTFKLVLKMRGLRVPAMMNCAGGDEPERQQALIAEAMGAKPK